MTANILLDAALFYAGTFNWLTFPVHSPMPGEVRCSCLSAFCENVGKHPRTPRGLLDATKDEKAIKHWWLRWPTANIGVRTGAESGFVVIDIDPNKGGDDSLESLQSKYGTLPTTAEALTGGGGRHLLFKHPGVPVKNSVCELGQGLDVRGDGGYVVAPPSAHESGNSYRWEMSSDPKDVPLADMPAWLVEIFRKPDGPQSASPATPAEGGGMKNLSRRTLTFLVNGAGEGERQTRAFEAAADLAGNGVPVDEAESRVVPAAVNSGLPEKEARQAVRSAYSRPRNPSRPVETVADDGKCESALQRQAGTAAANGNGKHSPASATVPAEFSAARKPTDGPRVRVSNVTDSSWTDKKGNVHPKQLFVPLPQIAAAVQEATGVWPRRAGGILFTPRELSAAAIPTPSDVQWIVEVDELFAWLGRTCDVRWASGEVEHAGSGDSLNAPTKRELFAYLKEFALPSYRGVECLPHYPPVPDLYYLPCRLPAAVDLGAADSPLAALVRGFNAETELDRLLMLAAMATMLWGGPPGARPAFVLSSDHGQGVGKTTTAQILAGVAGGFIGVSPREDFEKVRGRMLGDEALSLRVACIDNLRGKMSSMDVESLITTPVIDGWKPYFGQASRPNLLTWLITSNSPSLTKDLVERCIIIKLGKQVAGDFLGWATKFIAENRPRIIAELLAILAGPSTVIETKNRGRWAAWEEGVLGKLLRANELAELIINRRPDVDADTDDAEEIAKCVLGLVTDHHPGRHEEIAVFITRQQLYNRLLRDGRIDKTFGVKACVAWVRERCNVGPLFFLAEKRFEDGRGWLYTGVKAKPNTKVLRIPESQQEISP